MATKKKITKEAAKETIKPASIVRPGLAPDALFPVAAQCLDAMITLLQQGWSQSLQCTDDAGVTYHYADVRVTRFDLYGALYKSTRTFNYEIVDKERIEALIWQTLQGQLLDDTIHSFSQTCPNLETLLQVLQTARYELDPTPVAPKERKRI